MIVEVIAVGTEILLGQIVNSNTAFIGDLLAEKGLDAHFQVTVGDNLVRIASAVEEALARSDAVVITGGIGPTQDDITREAVCLATGTEMVFDQEYADHLRGWWERRGRPMPESNLRQAYHPEGAELLANPRGTAPGLALATAGKWVFCVPGVPAEMEHLMTAEVMPRLVAASGRGEVLASRVIRTWGRPESEVAETLDDLFASVNPSIAFLASSSEIKIRVTAKATDRAAANAMIEPMSAEVVERLGSSVFGYDDDTIEVILFRLLDERGWTIGTAESMTGGLVAARLTEPAGASRHVRGGVVAYHSDLKRSLLDVSDVSHVVDAGTAIEMASGARAALGVDVGVSVTGSAGPEPLEVPAGTVFVGVATPERSQARRLHYTGDRERVRSFATTAALQLARLAVTGEWWVED